jgi:hypothetical protein
MVIPLALFPEKTIIPGFLTKTGPVITTEDDCDCDEEEVGHDIQVFLWGVEKGVGCGVNVNERSGIAENLRRSGSYYLKHPGRE